MLMNVESVWIQYGSQFVLVCNICWSSLKPSVRWFTHHPFLHVANLCSVLENRGIERHLACYV
jgi:hypothetical protein